jgi:hypothetical protein
MNFTQEFLDSNGNLVVTVRVEYHQTHPYPPTVLVQQMNESKK